MVRFLCGDVGGTNCRLQLWGTTGEGEEALLKETTYPSNSFPSLTTTVFAFLKDETPHIGNYEIWPRVASFALAGPVVNNTCQFTNIGWTINGAEMKKALSLERVELMNDFVGLAYGLLALGPDDLVVLNDAPIQEGAPIACLGAGTGLGEVFLTHDGTNYVAFPTEGGHSDLPINNALDFELLEFIREKHKIPHVSAERIISGSGISNLFDFFCQKFPDLVNPEVKQDYEKRGAAAVSERALNNTDDLCVQALNTFARIYGTEAGDFALKTLPYRGLYIAGGIAPKILPILTNRNKFLAYIFDKGRMQKVLERVPIFIVKHSDPGLLGSRVIARRLLSGRVKETPIHETTSVPRASRISQVVEETSAPLYLDTKRNEHPARADSLFSYLGYATLFLAGLAVGYAVYKKK